MTMFSFAPLTPDHFPLLHKWMGQPHVWQWWGEGRSWSFHDIQEKYHSYTLGYKIEQGEKKAISPFVVHFQDRPIGFIQAYNAHDFPRGGFYVKDIEQEPSQSIAALDFYIGEPDCIGRGLGAEILKGFLESHVFRYFDACLVDPDKNNKVAIKTYAKANFSTLQELASSIVMIARKEEKKNPIIIFGSARSDGNTLQAIKTVIKDQPIPIVDLKELNIAHYDYSYANAKDDFISLAEKMVRHNPIILATPVYWYSMSALMKTFIDRWSDLLDTRKDIGRRLTNKELYVITSYGESVPRGFEDAFSQTCEYLDMQYKGCYYFYSGDNLELSNGNAPLASEFCEKIFRESPSFMSR
ncbi:MAG: GNAT family N-acetyltransferase [Rhabdochlamydiaceae bacterium]|nr:GNAT family N-acetyltransferase [Rhabdochlamydiaceae bacterium]